MGTDHLLTAEEVTLSYGKNPALRGATLQVGEGEIVAITGPSGSGKSTLLYCMAGIIQPDGGRITFKGRDVSRMNDDERSQQRRRDFGFVFQFGELIPELSILENVSLPLRLNSISSRAARTEATKMLERLAIAHLSDKRPPEVSGGEAQRAAVARALVHKPGVVFADEPTGSLDVHNGDVVLNEFVKLAKEEGATVLVVTHAPRVAEACDRRITLIDGVVE